MDGDDPLMPTTPVSEPGEWRYALYDVLTRTQVAEHMPFTVQPFTRSLPDAGTLTASLPVADPDVQKLDPWGRALPRRTSIVVLRDEQVVTEQIIWTRPGYKASDKTMTLNCSEPRSYFDKHRLLRPAAGYGSRKTLSFTQVDAFDVFRALVQDAQDVTYQGLSVGDLGIEMDPTVMSGVLIDRRDVADAADAYHGYQFAYYGQLMSDLATTVGFEWRVDSYLDGDNRLQRRLVLGYPHLGRGIEDDTLTLEYPGVIADYTVDDDGETSANYVAALAAGEEEAMLWAEAVNAPELLNGYPLLEAAVAHKDDASTTLAAGHAAGDLARLSGDVQQWTVDLVGYPNIGPGDYVRLRIVDEARWPGSSVAPMLRLVRATGMTITPGPKERTTLAMEDPRGGIL